MKERAFTLFGAVGPIVAYIFIGLSIVFSPWFSLDSNALSDLGHSVKSKAAPIYNLGLLLAGFLVTVYAITEFRSHAKYTSKCLVVSAFLLQLVATFNEAYGFLHFAVSVAFFVSLGVASLVYVAERKSYSAAAAFTVGVLIWICYWTNTINVGIAVPETISSTAALFWIIPSAMKTYRDAD